MNQYKETCERCAGVIAGCLQKMSEVELKEFAKLLAVTMCVDAPQTERGGLSLMHEIMIQVRDKSAEAAA